MILSRIARGKLTGDEEVAAPPDYEWRRLASLPAFYDAFIKRLYEGQYKPPSGDEAGEAPAEGAPPDGATVQPEGTGRPEDLLDRIDEAPIEDGSGQPELVPPVELATEHGKGFEGTINQALIDELFSDEDGEPSPPPKREATSLAKIDPIDENLPADIDNLLDRPLDNAPPPAPPESLAAPLDIAAQVAPEEAGPKRATARSSSKRRLLLWGVVFAGLMVLLLDSSSEPDVKPAKDAAAVAPTDPLLASDDPQRKKERLKALIREGDELCAQDLPLLYVRAAEIYREAAAVDPGSSEAQGRLAQALAFSLPDVPDSPKKSAELAAAIERGRRLDPHSSQFYRAESLMSLYQGKQEVAKTSILNAIETDPTSPENAMVLAEISYAIQDLDSAKSALEEALKGKMTKVRAYYYLARTELDLGNFGNARANAKKALELNPGHAGALLLLGDIARREKNLGEALRRYRASSRMARFASRKVSAHAFYKTAQMQEISGSAADADRSYVLAHYFDPGVDPDLAGRVRSLDTSQQAVEASLLTQTHGKEYFQVRAETFRQQKLPDLAFQHLQLAWALDPSDGELLLKMGEILEAKAIYYDEFLRVVSFYERAIGRNGSLTRAYVKLGLLETEQYNLDRAQQLLLRAKELSPEDPETFVALGKHYYKRQDYNRALDEFIQASKIKQQDSEILYYAAKMKLLFTRDPAEAMGLLEKSYKADPFNYDALIEWLRLKVINFDKNFAIKFVNNLIAAEPLNAKYQWALGEVYAANKDYKKAIALFHKALDLDNQDSRVRMSLARALEATGDIDKAIAEFKLGSRLDRRNLEGYYRAAELLVQARRFDEAEEVVKTLLDSSPRYPGAHRYLAQVYRAQGKEKESIEAMRKEVAQNPMNAKFRIELSELLMDYKKYEDAVTELTEITNLPSLSKAPEYVYDKIKAFVLLARCYRLLGRYESAEASILLALDIDPEDPVLHRELGYVYVAMQRNIEAVAEFRNYLSRSPAADDAEGIKRLMDKLVIPE